MKFLLWAVLVLLGGSAATAQESGIEPGTFGLTAQPGRVSSLGLVYHPMEKLAITPFVSFSPYSTALPRDGYSVMNSSGDWSYGGGVKAQYYLGREDRFSTYVGAGGSYLVSKSSFAVSGGGQESIRRSDDRTTSLGVYFGTQYDLVSWLSLYANIGAGVGFRSSKYQDEPNTSVKSTEFNFSNSGLGLMLYF